jgi:hypothetical protein
MSAIPKPKFRIFRIDRRIKINRAKNLKPVHPTVRIYAQSEFFEVLRRTRTIQKLAYLVYIIAAFGHDRIVERIPVISKEKRIGE